MSINQLNQISNHQYDNILRSCYQKFSPATHKLIPFHYISSIFSLTNILKLKALFQIDFSILARKSLSIYLFDFFTHKNTIHGKENLKDFLRKTHPSLTNFAIFLVNFTNLFMHALQWFCNTVTSWSNQINNCDVLTLQLIWKVAIFPLLLDNSCSAPVKTYSLFSIL